MDLMNLIEVGVVLLFFGLLIYMLISLTFFIIKTLKNTKNKRIKKENLKESELIIAHYKGFERGDMSIIGYDKEILRSLSQSLNNRGIQTELFEDLNVGMTHFKLNLTDNYSGFLFEKINRYLSLADKYFVNGRPIPDINYFTLEELEMLENLYGQKGKSGNDKKKYSKKI